MKRIKSIIAKLFSPNVKEKLEQNSSKQKKYSKRNGKPFIKIRTEKREGMIKRVRYWVLRNRKVDTTGIYELPINYTTAECRRHIFKTIKEGEKTI